MALTLQSIFTAAGMSLAQDALAGNCKIVFTRGVASIADWSQKSADDIRAATKLDDETQVTGIDGISTRQDSGGKTEQNAVDVLITFNQKDIKADYQLRTVGLFAAPVVDGKQGTEVLYNVTCYSEPQWMLQDSNGSTFTLSIATIVGDLGNVTVVLPSNSDGGLTQDALNLFHAQLDEEYAQKTDLDPYAKTTDLTNATKDMLTKTVADQTYQKAGSYATTDAIKDMATNTGVDNKLKNYAQNGAIADMETKTDAKATYQQKGDYATNDQTIGGIKTASGNTLPVANRVAALPSARNFVIGTSDKWQKASVPDSFGVQSFQASPRFFDNSSNGFALSVEIRNASKDCHLEILIEFDDGTQLYAASDPVTAGASALSPVTAIVIVNPADLKGRVITSVTYIRIADIGEIATTGDSREWRGLTMNAGSVPGDWQPAPEDMQSQIDTLNNKISALQAEISGRGRNLLKDTTFIKKQWTSDYGHPQIEFTDDGLKLTSTWPGQFGALNTAGIPVLVEDHTYTVSVEARGTARAQFYMMGKPENSQLFDYSSKSSIEVDSTDWTPVSVSFAYHAPVTSTSGFEIFGADGGWIEFKKGTLMLTEGSEVVPWEPAAGDPALVPDLAALAARVTALENK